MNDIKKRTRQSLKDSENECSSVFVKDATSPQKSSKKSRTESPLNNIGLVTPPTRDSIDVDGTSKQELYALYSESVVAKVWGIANRALGKSSPPTLFPEYTKPGGTKYVYRESEFWTSGFFPGCIYLLLQRQRRYPQAFPSAPFSGIPQTPHPLQLQYACKWWTVNLYQNASLTTTHDLSFMISPWAHLAWELDHDVKAYETLITAAKTLATRYNMKIECLRSWDTCVTKRYSFTDPSLDFLVIIDNMMNLDLLFWAAIELRDPKLRDIAVNHARMTQRHHIRPDSSTFHVVNFDQATGNVKAKMTNQGYSDDSCWSRGQSWAITGFAQTYSWTRDKAFLTTARECADYFLAHLPSNGVPYWDFSAPVTQDTPTDTSAAVIACYGMLLLHEALTALGEQSPYLKGAMHILMSICATQMSPPVHFTTSNISVPSVEHGVSSESGPLEVDTGSGAETILAGATINNYEFAPRRWANHGLVYADYYFLLIGNKLLDMGMGGQIASRSL